MQLSDPRKMAIFAAMENKYDLKDFLAQCAAFGLVVRGTELEYAQKVGMVLYAANKFPNTTMLEAYMLLMSGASPIDVPVSAQGSAVQIETQDERNAQKSCCGGGQIR